MLSDKGEENDEERTLAGGGERGAWVGSAGGGGVVLRKLSSCVSRRCLGMRVVDAAG